MKIVKIGGVELTPEEAMKYYQEERYIVNYGGIYQLHYSAAQRTVYGNKIYTGKGLTRKGRFFAMDAQTVNHLVGFKLVRENGEEDKEYGTDHRVSKV